jgi:hypothetical protein
VDAGASLRPCAIEVQLGDWIYTIPELPAADWIEAVLSEDAGAIVPGLFDYEDQADVRRSVLLGDLDPEELANGWRHALSAAVGQPWWKAARLIMAATQDDAWPQIHGWLTERGVDLDKVSIGAFWNTIYYRGKNNCEDESARTKFDFQLDTPPPGVTVQEAFEEVDAAGDFLSAMSAFQNLQGGGPAG